MSMHFSTDGCFYAQGMFRPALARVIGSEAGNPIFGTPNDPLLRSRITRSDPGVELHWERLLGQDGFTAFV